MKNEKIESNPPNIKLLLKKNNDFHNIVQKTILAIQKYKVLDIISASDINTAIESLQDINQRIIKMRQKILSKAKIDVDLCIDQLQEINNELTILFRNYGTENVEDLLNTCFGTDYINNEIPGDLTDKFELIRKFLHPINYKIMGQMKTKKVSISKNKVVEDFMIVDTGNNLDCYDLARNSENFQTKVYGIKVIFHNNYNKKSIIINGIIDDLIIDFINNRFITNKLKRLYNIKSTEKAVQGEDYDRFVKSLTIKDLLVYSDKDLFDKYIGSISQINLIKSKAISLVVNEFITSELYQQRLTLIQLLLREDNPEFKYLAYLLYDLLSNDNNGNIDTTEQTILYDSLPWEIKKFFRDAMRDTIQYTNNLSNFDNNKIPLEQQICLLKASDTVKEKAMVKLREVKSKEDSGSKARQYLEGLLKIPFSCYREEKILTVTPIIKQSYSSLLYKCNILFDFDNYDSKKNYSNIEIYKDMEKINSNYIINIKNILIEKFLSILYTTKRHGLVNIISSINATIKQNNCKYNKLLHSGKNSQYMKDCIKQFIEIHKEQKFIYLILYELLGKEYQKISIEDIKADYNKINTQMLAIKDYMSEVHQVLDKSVHGHARAKRQIERIIGQWINGGKAGYCFGFEGPPGVGKTSLAKCGLSACLKDEDGVSRPFSFIAVGGSANGSVLEGHNYTYVGSTWGKIVDIIIEKKILNPIIFIDELDKVSRTEHGREIIGILTHLIDTTQNDTFQDKYFSGIDIDLSRALFVFSYNDVDAIDRILLDRIHRIKFDTLDLDDKIIITKKYILPEICEKMGLTNVIEISDDVITYVIEEFTLEAGVRKLKELFFEIIGEINIEILNEEEEYSLPIIITKEGIRTKYLKDKHEINAKKIHTESEVGIINGLWANSVGGGGIIPIQAKFFPTTTYLELKLTGMQGDVMKESMNVAKTLAFSQTPTCKLKKFSKTCNDTNLQGLHIHCPEGAIPKDGPSAGAAITTAIYSIINNKKIKNNIGITGEINLQGKITEIGGLDLKFLGGIRAGITEFIFPEANKRDFNDFMNKYKNKETLKNIKFHPVDNIKRVFDLILI